MSMQTVIPTFVYNGVGYTQVTGDELLAAGVPQGEIDTAIAATLAYNAAVATGNRMRAARGNPATVSQHNNEMGIFTGISMFLLLKALNDSADYAAFKTALQADIATLSEGEDMTALYSMVDTKVGSGIYRAPMFAGNAGLTVQLYFKLGKDLAEEYEAIEAENA